MRTRVKLLSLTVWITVSLLTLGATLVVLGIFNEVLKWDIFGPQIEAFLYGIFWASVALAFFGVAITFVLGIQEIVKAVGELKPNQGDSSAIAPESRRLTYVAYMMGILAVLSAIISFLSLINNQIQIHRNRVFKKIVVEQMQVIGNKFGPPLSELQKKPSNAVPKTIYELMNTLDELSFIETTTLYMPAPKDDSALWRYQAWGNYNDRKAFERFFIAKETEKAIKKALEGDGKMLNTINEKTEFKWFYVIKSDNGKPMAVLKIDGNKGDNFREYTLGN